jgi:hypothetical protein
MYYLLPLLLPALMSEPGPALPDGLRKSPFLEPELIPVVVPDFILLCFTLPDFILVPVAPGPTLPSLDAPGAGCICADAIVVAPNSAATTRVEIASLDRMVISCWIDDAGDTTCDADLGSEPGAHF